MYGKLYHTIRIILGISLFLLGTNYFLDYLPTMGYTEPAKNLMEALIESGYIMPIVAIYEIVLAVFLLFHRYVPLMVILLAPLTVNAFLYHLFLNPQGLAVWGIMLIMNIYMIFPHVDKFKPFMTPK